MTIETTPRSEDRSALVDPHRGPADGEDHAVDATVTAASRDDVLPGAVFTAVVTGGLEQWRVVAVLGIRVLAERLEGSERRSFTLRFVRYRLSLPADGQEVRRRGEDRRSA